MSNRTKERFDNLDRISLDTERANGARLRF